MSDGAPRAKRRPTRNPRYFVAEVTDRLDELRAAATACKDDTALAAANAILDAVVEALTRKDVGWLAPIAQNANKYSDEHARKEGWRPVRSQGDEGRHLTGCVRAVLEFAPHGTDSDIKRAARLVEGSLHAALARCTGVWKQIPSMAIQGRSRTLRSEIRAQARDALRRLLEKKDWAHRKTPERVVTSYLRTIGLDAKAAANVVR